MMPLVGLLPPLLASLHAVRLVALVGGLFEEAWLWL